MLSYRHLVSNHNIHSTQILREEEVSCRSLRVEGTHARADGRNANQRPRRHVIERNRDELGDRDCREVHVDSWQRNQLE